MPFYGFSFSLSLSHLHSPLSLFFIFCSKCGLILWKMHPSSIFFPQFAISYIFLKNSYWYSITVVCIYPTTPHHKPSPPPSLASTPLWFCPCVLLPFSPLSSPISPLVTVRLFLISMSLVIFCLLVCFVD